MTGSTDHLRPTHPGLVALHGPRLNPFDEYDEASCVSSIKHLAGQLAAGATQITSLGGGAQFMGVAAAERMIWQLRSRLAVIRSLPAPVPPSRQARRRATFQAVIIDLGY